MLPSSRLEPAWSGVLLLSIFTPWAIADELPTGRYRVRPREVVRTVAATEDDVEKAKVDSAAEKRWSELKARHTKGAAAPQLPPKPIPEAAESPAPKQPAKLIAADGDAGEENWFDAPESEQAAPTLRKEEAAPQSAKTEAIPLHDSPDGQPWIYGLAPSEKESDEPAPRTAMRNTERAEPEVQEQPVPQAGTTDVAGQVPKMKPPRRPRKIDEITPRYDLSLDQDIRQFAAQQAQQYDVHFQRESFPQRSFTGVVYNWEAANFHYLPLYFQDPQLERYGHTYPCYLQPAASIARFGVQLIGMPYQMAIKPPWSPEYPLGWYRPGDVAPKLCYQIPWNTKAALVEAGVITGAFFIIP